MKNNLRDDNTGKNNGNVVKSTKDMGMPPLRRPSGNPKGGSNPESNINLNMKAERPRPTVLINKASPDNIKVSYRPINIIQEG